MSKLNLISFITILFFSFNTYAQSSNKLVIEKDSLINNFSLLKSNDYSVNSFEFVCTAKGFDRTAKGNSDKLSSSMVKFIKMLDSGQKVLFCKINAIDNSGKAIKLKDIVVTIK
jgi:hypothetical protein